MHEVPTFVVVGHPNKGKSSVVAALTQDDSVRIAPRSGTTTQSEAFDVTIDDRVIYRLVDTPGFQRPRRALSWMREHASTAADRPDAVRAFLTQHAGTGVMDEECALLQPLIDGGLAVYVVDGSVPYGPEYEDEMEILRWTGRPGLGLVNPIRSSEHLDSWITALRQFLGVVCVFNPVEADYRVRIDVLNQFGTIASAHDGPAITDSLSLLEADRERAHQRAARTLAEWVARALTERVEQLLGKDAIVTACEPELRDQYQEQLREAEKRCRSEVERVYRHRRLERTEEALAFNEGDLFAADRWYLWGLDRRQMLTTLGASGVTAGAAGGVVVDVGLGGSSLAAGAVIGSMIGGASGLWAGLRYSDRLADVRLGPVKLAGRRAIYGPSTNPNLPFVVLGRALAHHRVVARWSHARREVMAIEPESAEAIWHEPAFDAVRRDLEIAFRKIRSTRGDDAAIQRLSGLLKPLLSLTDSYQD
ncbi:MAG: DUF3482 domain-containing protein [Phycisphaeraceae bacterium]